MPSDMTREAGELDRSPGQPGAVALPLRDAGRAMNDSPDSRLVRRCQEGDMEAYCALASMYRDRVHAFVSRGIRDPSAAEDLVQDVFVNAYAHIGRFGRRASFQTWIFRIAHNRVIDHNRRERRRRLVLGRSLDSVSSHDGSEAEVPIPDLAAEPARAVERSELSRCLDEAIRGLSDKLRAVVVLYDIEGMPYEEIAQVLGCPVGTVKSRLFNARAELRRKLAPYLAADAESGVG